MSVTLWYVKSSLHKKGRKKDFLPSLHLRLQTDNIPVFFIKSGKNDMTTKGEIRIDIDFVSD